MSSITEMSVKTELDTSDPVIHDSPISGTPVSPVTPSRRNKRKMTEPRRRSDAVKRICNETCSPPSDSEEDNGLQSAQLEVDKVIKQINSQRLSFTKIPSARKFVTPGSRSDGEERDSGNSGSSPSPSPEDCSPTPVTSDKIPLVMPVAYDHMALYARAYQFGLPGLPSVGLPPTGLSLQHHSNSAHTSLTAAMPVSVISSMSTKSNSNTTPSPNPKQTEQSPCTSDDDPNTSRKNRKNYKNMTRERRVEANARERSRVHTISAAFENLRRAVPSYSYNQKLSKLAILRIACSYILSLAKLADLDYTQDQRDVSFEECVDMCTATIQSEGRPRRRH